MSVETWLTLSVILNLSLIAGILGGWYGWHITKPLRELTIHLREQSARMDEKAGQWSNSDV